MERLTTYIYGYAHGAEGVREDSLTGNYCRGEFEATAIVDRLASIEDILGDDYDIDRLRELVQADKEGRIRILSAGKGKSCGTCANFQPVPGHKCGDCKARKYFRASQSRKACSMYIGKDK